MSATDNSSKRTRSSSSSSKQSPNAKVRPHDPSQLVDVHPPPTPPPPTWKIPKLLFPVSYFPNRRRSLSSKTEYPYLPSTDPLTWLEQRRVLANNGNGAAPDVYPTPARPEHVHWRSKSSDGVDEDERPHFKHGALERAKEKAKAKEAERKIEAWDWEAWERSPAEQERRRAVQRNNERRHLERHRPKSLERREQDVHIGDREDEESDDTYADVDSISILEHSSTHTKSRPPSSDGPRANRPSQESHRPSSQDSPKMALQTHPSTREQSPGDIIRLPGRLRSKFSQRPCHQNIRKNGITVTSVGCDQSAYATIQATGASRSEDQIIPMIGEKKEQRKRDGWEHCGDDRVNDDHGNEVEERSTSTESLLFDPETPAPVLGLRGGAGDDDGNERKSKRLEDDERVPALIWYLAGNKGIPPTGKQLRDRREKEKAYSQRMQAEADARKEARSKAKGEETLGGFWRHMLGQNRRIKVKLRGDEEDTEKEVADGGDTGPPAGGSE